MSTWRVKRLEQRITTYVVEAPSGPEALSLAPQLQPLHTLVVVDDAVSIEPAAEVVHPLPMTKSWWPTFWFQLSLAQTSTVGSQGSGELLSTQSSSSRKN